MARLPYTHSGVLAPLCHGQESARRPSYRGRGCRWCPPSSPPGRGRGGSRHWRRPYVGQTLQRRPPPSGSTSWPEAAKTPPPKLGARDARVVMVEPSRPGRELTTSVIGAGAERLRGRWALTDIPHRRLYTTRLNTARADSRHVVPADIPRHCGGLRDYALRAHAALGLPGREAATDFSAGTMDRAFAVLILLVDQLLQLPGMTPTSMVPEQAVHRGIAFPDLCRWMVEDASCDSLRADPAPSRWRYRYLRLMLTPGFSPDVAGGACPSRWCVLVSGGWLAQETNQLILRRRRSTCASKFENRRSSWCGGPRDRRRGSDLEAYVRAVMPRTFRSPPSISTSRRCGLVGLGARPGRERAGAGLVPGGVLDVFGDPPLIGNCPRLLCLGSRSTPRTEVSSLAGSTW